jgi:2-polyprenyl-6-methoxyphenol hydroxylase-like FAD-dependent oxidoreductase
MSNDLERSTHVDRRPTTRRKALIVGGGIGGPTAALALQRAGIEATVYEATMSLRITWGSSSTQPPTAWTF